MKSKQNKRREIAINPTEKKEKPRHVVWQNVQRA
jgi:hypothetical protein